MVKHWWIQNMAASSAPLSSSPALAFNFKPKTSHFILAHNTFSPLPRTQRSRAFPSTHSPTKNGNYLNPQRAIPSQTTQRWRLSANLGKYLLSEVSPVESSQEIVATTDDGVSTIISSLLFIAFIGLSILTVGVIYIAVTDFLQKREKEKFEKEEASSKKKKGGKKGKIRATSRAGPRGFGQKIEEDDDVDE